MTQLKNAVRSRYLISLAIALIILFIISLVYSYQTLESAFNSSPDAIMSAVMLKALIVFFKYIPYPLILALYNAYFYIDNRELSHSDTDTLYIYDISKTIIAVSSAIIVFYLAFSFLFSPLIFEARRGIYLKQHRDNYTRYKNALIDYYTKEGNKLVLEKSFERGITNYNNALFYDPYNNAALEGKEKAYELIKERDLSETEKNYRLKLVELGVREFLLKHYATAKMYFNRVIKIEPYNPEALYYLEKIKFIEYQKEDRLLKSINTGVEFLFLEKSFDSKRFRKEMERTFEQFKKENYIQARRYLNELFELYPFRKDVQDNYIRLGLQATEHFLATGNKSDEELIILRKLYRGLKLFKEKKYYEAYKQFKKTYEYALKEDNFSYHKEVRNTYLISFNRLTESPRTSGILDSEKRSILSKMARGVAFYKVSEYEKAYEIFKTLNNKYMGRDSYPFKFEVQCCHSQTLNKILREEFLYEDSNTEEIIILKRLKRGIKEFDKENYWRAYDVFSELYEDFPFNKEIKNYYTLTCSKLSKRDFLLREAKHVYDFAVLHKNLSDINDDIREKNEEGNNIPLIELSENLFPKNVIISMGKKSRTYLFSEYIIYYNNDVYFFNNVLFRPTFDHALVGKSKYDFFKYGKFVKRTGDRPKNAYALALKGRMLYDGTIDDVPGPANEFIDIEIEPRTFDYAASTKSELNYASPGKLFEMRKHFPTISYAVEPVLKVLARRLVMPLWFLLLVSVFTFYSLRYRLAFDKKAHPFHVLFGNLGLILAVFFLSNLFNYFLDILSSFESLLLLFGLPALILFPLFMAYSLGIARYHFYT